MPHESIHIPPDVFKGMTKQRALYLAEDMEERLEAREMLYPGIGRQLVEMLTKMADYLPSEAPSKDRLAKQRNAILKGVSGETG